MSIRYVAIFGVLFSFIFSSSTLGMAATPAASSTNVSVGITIGDTRVESAADDGNGNLALAQETTLSQTATIQSLSFYVTRASGDLILGIYDATGSNGGPGVLKAKTNGFVATTGWNKANGVTPVSLPAGKYWLAYLPSSSNLHFRKHNNSGNCVYHSRSYGSGLPATFPNSSVSCSYTTWSFYAIE
jgi:hypothetical protein